MMTVALVVRLWRGRRFKFRLDYGANPRPGSGVLSCVGLAEFARFGRMPFVCSATWIAREGSEETVRAALEQLSPLSRLEQGAIYYQAFQSPDAPRVFRIFEVYDDEAAFQAHLASEHFATWALGQAIPALEDRHREIYETLPF